MTAITLSTQVYSLDTRTWRDGQPPQKDRALHGCSRLGEDAVVVAGNDFSPMDLAEVKLIYNVNVLLMEWPIDIISDLLPRQ